MIQGSTPTHTFTLPIDVTDVKEVRILYGQNNTLVFKKLTEDCVLTDKQISVTLTQEDTFQFDEDEPVQIQVRVLTTDNKSLVSPIAKVSINQCLDDEVLV